MRTPLPLILATLFTLLLATPVGAGGWATVTLDQLPSELRAGATHTLGYTILQHGVTPFAGSRSVIRARSASGQTLTFPARPQGAPGHYLVDVTFPTAGTWTWEVVPEPFAPQPLGSIIVTRASAPALAPVPFGGTPLPTLILRGALAAATIFAGISFALHLAQSRRAVPAIQ